MHFQNKIYKFQRDEVGVNYPIYLCGARADLHSGKDMDYRTLTGFLKTSASALTGLNFSCKETSSSLAKKRKCCLATQDMRALINNKNEF
jgi:hypothetical protein